MLQIVTAAAIPLVAGAGAGSWITGSLGASIVVLEGFQQLFQFQQNWIGYRATSEALKHEKFLYLMRAGPYRDSPAPDAVLAERVEGLVSQEHSSSSAAQAQVDGRDPRDSRAAARTGLRRAANLSLSAHARHRVAPPSVRLRALEVPDVWPATAVVVALGAPALRRRRAAAAAR